MKRPRGRPPKPKPEPQRLFIAPTISISTIDQRSQEIATKLGVTKSAYTTDLAGAGQEFELMADLQKKAPIKRTGRGVRPTIHVSRLLCDCARALEKHHGLNAQNELSRIYDGVKGENHYPVIRAAEAVLKVMGVAHGSLRRQAKNARAIL